MSEKRVPELTILLKRKGKRKFQKVEIFKADLWPRLISKGRYRWRIVDTRVRYRLRVNGVWFNDKDHKFTLYLLYEIRDIFWRSIKRFLNR